MGVDARTVGAVLRGRPWFKVFAKLEAVVFLNLLNNQGRPQRAAPRVRAEVASDLGIRRWRTKELRGVTKDQPVEIGVVTQWIQIVIMLGSHT